jgi:hypothetical protein
MKKRFSSEYASILEEESKSFSLLASHRLLPAGARMRGAQPGTLIYCFSLSSDNKEAQHAATAV